MSEDKGIVRWIYLFYLHAVRRKSLLSAPSPGGIPDWSRHLDIRQSRLCHVVFPWLRTGRLFVGRRSL